MKSLSGLPLFGGAFTEKRRANISEEELSALASGRHSIEEDTFTEDEKKKLREYIPNIWEDKNA